MGTFETTISINRPAAEVFDVLADTEQIPLWYEAVVSAAKTSPGPVGRGSRYRLVRSLPGGLVENDYVSGAADAAYYIGECNACRSTIRHVVARLSAVGYSGTNASGRARHPRLGLGSQRRGNPPELARR